MKKLTKGEIGRKRLTIEQLRTAERLPIHVLLDNVRSLYNVGSIFRSADGARISKVVLCGYTPHPPRTEIEKTALGATQSVPWEYTSDPLAAISKLRSEGIRICALEQTDSSIPYHSVTGGQFPLCLIVGNEITGVSRDLIAASDIAVEIPMHGMKQSLNVAVALGVVIFEFVNILNGRR